MPKIIYKTDVSFEHCTFIAWEPDQYGHFDFWVLMDNCDEKEMWIYRCSGDINELPDWVEIEAVRSCCDTDLSDYKNLDLIGKLMAWQDISGYYSPANFGHDIPDTYNEEQFESLIEELEKQIS